MFLLFKRVLVIGFVLSIVSCSNEVSITRSVYIANSEHGLVDVMLSAKDDLKFNDAIDISLYTHNSCYEKPNLSELAHLSSEGLFVKKSVKSKSVNLEPKKVLNFYVSHRANVNSNIISCWKMRSYVLEGDRKYKLEIYNRSTERSTMGGFGCDFELFSIDIAGHYSVLQRAIYSGLPRCQ